MKKRYGVSRKKSRRSFRRGARVHRKNSLGSSRTMRGGRRL